LFEKARGKSGHVWGFFSLKIFYAGKDFSVSDRRGVNVKCGGFSDEWLGGEWVSRRVNVRGSDVSYGGEVSVK